MQFSDTHCHLYVEQFDEERQSVIEAADNAFVRRFFLPNIDSTYIERLHELHASHPNTTFPMMGLHPCSVNKNFEYELDIMENLLFYKKPVKYTAVGEIGIDLYWDKSFFEQQKEAFRIQVGWAKKLRLPIAIHVRNAFEEIFELMDELYDDKLSGVFHCFTGNAQERDKILEYENFFFGIGGVLTFKNSGLAEVVEEMPLDRIVLETDSPYLAPHPFRGKRNEPSYMMYIAESLSKQRGLSLGELSKITEANTNKLFKLEA